MKNERDSLKNRISELEDKNKFLSDKNDKLENDIVDKAKAIEIANRKTTTFRIRLQSIKSIRI